MCHEPVPPSGKAGEVHEEADARLNPLFSLSPSPLSPLSPETETKQCRGRPVLHRTGRDVGEMSMRDGIEMEGKAMSLGQSMLLSIVFIRHFRTTARIIDVFMHVYPDHLPDQKPQNGILVNTERFLRGVTH